MTFELMLLAQRCEHRYRDQAARFQIKPWPLPYITPGIARDVVLYGQREVCGIAKGIGDKVFTHDLLAGGQTFVKVFVFLVFCVDQIGQEVLLKKLSR